ncbi:hypothetical protein B0J14DRAFT_581865 [Halenospora varia]|nr:hypothetical protein B0J14DRAFT_581865 [Halenospora varia]
MHLNTSNSALFALSCLFSLTSTLPLSPRKIEVLEPLVRRATYSVVPVDGGSAPSVTTIKGSPSTILSVITEVETPPPTTIIQTDKITLSPTTDHVVTTQTLPATASTETDVVTITPSAVTVTKTGYSIIDINSPTTTVQVTAPAPTTSQPSISNTPVSPSNTIAPVVSSSQAFSVAPPPTTSSTATTSLEKPSRATIPTTSTISISTTLVTSTTSSSTGSTITSGSSPSSTPSNVAESTSTTLASTTPLATISSSSAIPTSSSSIFDNGQWHTTYPAWSNSTGTATIPPQSAQATPATEPSTPVKVPERSIPLTYVGGAESLQQRDILRKPLARPRAPIEPEYKREASAGSSTILGSSFSIIRSFFS